MRTFFISFFILLSALTARSQGNRPLDSATLAVWPSVENCSITPDGRFVQYCIRNVPAGSATSEIQSLDGHWKLKLPGVDNVVFTEDGGKAVYEGTGDSLFVIDLGRKSTSFVSRVSSYSIDGRGPILWLTYVPAEGVRLVLYDLHKGNIRTFDGASGHWISNDGRNMILEKKIAGVDSLELEWIVLSEGSHRSIWKGKEMTGCVLDPAGEQVAFLSGKDSAAQLMYYKMGMPSATVVPTGSEGLYTGEPLSFTKNGHSLFFYLKEKRTPAVWAGPPLDVWTYRDPILQSEQLEDPYLRGDRPYLAIIHLDKDQVIRLEQEDDAPFPGGMTDETVVFNTRAGDVTEWGWARTGEPSYTVVSTATGERKEFHLQFPRLTEDEKYVVGFDDNRRDLFCYELATGTMHNITENILPSVTDDQNAMPEWRHAKGLFYGGCIPGEHRLLVYDTYDIWKVDPQGQEKPVCITHGYGRSHHIVFRLGERYEDNLVPTGRDLILSAFGSRSKDNGFYRLRALPTAVPEPLLMGPYLYFDPGIGYGQPLVKAKNAAVYIVQRQSTTESPNYFWSSDMRSLHPISSVFPEKAFRWPESRLCSFRSGNGDSLQGVLYTPGDLDPAKQYPVIIHYYERRSDELHQYHAPQEHNGFLDISWFVSHGYLVFTPDIRYAIGEVGQSAYNAIVGAADYLSSLPFVDSGRIGLQGHSFGGYETNYVITHSNRFRAAVASSGMSDMVGDYFDFWGGGASRAEYYEDRQGRMEVGPWVRPDRYIRNSPIFSVGKVTTPILLISNKDDHNVSFKQGVEMFLALRHLGKKAWMLQYDGQSHGLDGPARLDYTIRMTQFFNFFLKDDTPPKWMTRGIPASEKGRVSGLEADTESKGLSEGIVKQK